LAAGSSWQINDTFHFAPDSSWQTNDTFHFAANSSWQTNDTFHFAAGSSCQTNDTCHFPPTVPGSQLFRMIFPQQFSRPYKREFDIRNCHSVAGS
jgi:hypothetical protein